MCPSVCCKQYFEKAVVWSSQCLEHTFSILFYNCIVPLGFRPFELWLLFPGKASCDSHATKLTVHAGCFSVSITHRTLTWITGSLKCTQMLMQGSCTWVCMDAVRQTMLKVDSGRKILWHSRESDLPQRASPSLYQLSYIPSHERWRSVLSKTIHLANQACNLNYCTHSLFEVSTGWFSVLPSAMVLCTCTHFSFGLFILRLFSYLFD